MKLGIGTAQFGLDYGIANVRGQVPLTEVKEILAVAKSRNVKVLDTAALYGKSEEILGAALEGDTSFEITTKTPQFGDSPITQKSAASLEEVFLRSLERMRQDRVYGLLIHQADNLLAAGGSRLFEKMQRLKSRGLVEKIGVSVYEGRQIDRILDEFSVDLVQVPINVLDQRLIAGGQLARLKSRGVEIHARSAFLQGLLLMHPEKVPDYFDPIRSQLRSFHAFATNQGLDAAGAALSFIASVREIDVVICGIDNVRQFRQLCSCAEMSHSCSGFEPFAVNDPAIVDPSRWQVNVR